MSDAHDGHRPDEAVVRRGEVLTHLEGTVPAYPPPDFVWTGQVLVTAGRWLAQAHAASAGFDREGRSGSRASTSRPRWCA